MQKELGMEKKLDQALFRSEFPRSNRYNAQWVIENQMGLNPLWLTEWTCEKLPLAPNACVLDLGCGRGLSSIFLAKEYKARVWAADLWVKPTENFARFKKAGVQNRVFPIYADAHTLPFAEEYFDAIFCTDAFIYFGTDDLYLEYLCSFLKPGGQLGITMPGFMKELDGSLPDHLLPFWAQECWTWHTVDWWRWHWERTGLVEEINVDVLSEGWNLWLQWKKARAIVEGEKPSLSSDIKVLETDRGQYMGFIRMVAKKK
jgi:SAM-dependent methyltransferase